MLPSDCQRWLSSKGKIDRAGTALAEDPTSYTALQQVQCYRLFRALAFPDIFALIMPALENCDVRVAGRLKRLPSIVRKVGREQIVNLGQLADLIGIRIVCSSAASADRICASVSRQPNFKKTIDYIADPRDTGYRCRHCIIRVDQEWPSTKEIASFDVEIQVRSWWQHLWALISEGYGEQVKEGGGSKEVRSYLQALSKRIAEIECQDPEQPQVVFSAEGATQNIVVSRQPFRGGVRPYSENFKSDYKSAMRRLVAWEEDLGASDYTVLLLIGIGAPKILGQTHSIYFGAETIPLPSWAPKPPTISKFS